MKKSKAFLKNFSYAGFFLIISLLISCSHFYGIFITTAKNTFSNRMSQYAANTGKTAPTTFDDFLNQLQNASYHFKKLSFILFFLLLGLSSGFMIFMLQKKKKTWLDKMEESETFCDLLKELSLKTLPFFIFTLLLASSLLFLGEGGILKFLQEQFNHYLPHYIPENITSFFKTYNSQSSILLPFSSQNFFTMNSYLQGIEYSLFPSFLTSYVLVMAWNFTLFIGGLYSFKKKYFKQ